jgi:hypothetical protein
MHNELIHEGWEARRLTLDFFYDKVYYLYLNSRL